MRLSRYLIYLFILGGLLIYLFPKIQKCELEPVNYKSVHQSTSNALSITQVAAGKYHSVFLDANGRIFICGDNILSQQEGDPRSQEDWLIPTEITHLFKLEEDEIITDIYSGSIHSAVLTSNHRVFTWGNNAEGQVNYSFEFVEPPTDITPLFSLDENEYIVQLSLGRFHSGALTNLNRVFTWGGDAHGQLGNGETTSDMQPPTDITEFFDLTIDEFITDIAFGNVVSSALTNNHSVFTWGSNIYGELANSTETSTATPQNITSHFNLEEQDYIIDIVMRAEHTTFISHQGKLYTSGLMVFPLYIIQDNMEENNIEDDFWRLSPKQYYSPNHYENYYQLNDFNITGIHTLSAGVEHFVLITNDYDVITFGLNLYGRLGNGLHNINYSSNLLNERFSFAEDEYAIDVSSWLYHTVLLTNKGRVFTWGGTNENGELGIGTTNHSYIPVLIDEYKVIIEENT